jgi:hypothetical protein
MERTTRNLARRATLVTRWIERDEKIAHLGIVARNLKLAEARAYLAIRHGQEFLERVTACHPKIQMCH